MRKGLKEQRKEEMKEERKMGKRNIYLKEYSFMNIFKYHVFAPKGRFQLELFFLYFFLLDGRTVENKGKLILNEIFPSVQKHDI